MPDCDCCGQTYKSWGHHIRWNPQCEEINDEDDDDTDMPMLVSNSDSEDEEVEENFRELKRSIGETAMQETVAEDLLTMRFKYGFEEAEVNHLKRYVDKWVALRDKLHESTGKLTPLFDGLQTKKQEFARIRTKPGYVEPRRVKAGEHDIVSFDPAVLLTRMLQNKKAVRREVEQASETFKSGSLHKKSPSVLSTVLDGIAARYHPELMRKATLEEADDLRVPLVFNLDDIEVRRTPCPMPCPVPS